MSDIINTIGAFDLLLRVLNHGWARLKQMFSAGGNLKEVLENLRDNQSNLRKSYHVQKSKKSAFLMASFFIIPMVTIAIVVGQVRYYLLPPAERNPNVTNGFAGIIPAMIAVGILLLSLGIAASIIYLLNESHYGRLGAVRWAAAGTIYGILQQLVLTPIPSEFNFEPQSIAKQIGGDILW